MRHAAAAVLMLLFTMLAGIGAAMAERPPEPVEVVNTPLPVRGVVNVNKAPVGEVYSHTDICNDTTTIACDGPSNQLFFPVPEGKFLRIDYISIDAIGPFVEGSARLGAINDGFFLGNLAPVSGETGQSLGISVSIPFDETVNCCGDNGFLVSVNFDESSTDQFVYTRVRVIGTLFPAEQP